MRTENDNIHEGQRFHIICEREIVHEEGSGSMSSKEITTQWQTVNITQIGFDKYQLDAISDEETEADITKTYPLVGMITPYYMQDKI